MALVGNDVVFVDDPAVATHHLRDRWLARVFERSEFARVVRSAHPRELAWALFAAKEAAYKVVSKLVPGIVFAHRRFVVSGDERRVRYGDLHLPLTISRGPGWVHAIAATHDVRVLSGIERDDHVESSAAVRRLACSELASRLGTSDLRVVRDLDARRWDRRGPPYLVCRDRRVPVDLSLSHDGPFVAFAAVTQGTSLRDEAGQ